MTQRRWFRCDNGYLWALSQISCTQTGNFRNPVRVLAFHAVTAKSAPGEETQI
jgi:hypothetical protein